VDSQFLGEAKIHQKALEDNSRTSLTDEIHEHPHYDKNNIVASLEPDVDNQSQERTRAKPSNEVIDEQSKTQVTNEQSQAHATTEHLEEENINNKQQ